MSYRDSYFNEVAVCVARAYATFSVALNKFFVVCAPLGFRIPLLKEAKFCKLQPCKISAFSKKEIVASHFAFASIVEELELINPLYFIDVNGSKVV